MIYFPVLWHKEATHNYFMTGWQPLGIDLADLTRKSSEAAVFYKCIDNAHLKLCDLPVVNKTIWYIDERI